MVYLHDADHSIRILPTQYLSLIIFERCSLLYGKIHTILHTYHVTSLKGYGPTGGLVKDVVSITTGIPRDSLRRDSEVGIIK